MLEITNKILQKIKKEKPLILNYTNEVTVDFVANGLLSIGASPVMSQAEEEIEDLVKIAQSVVVNLGTLNKEFVKLCEHVCEIANTLKKPIILDPVGAGASSYRTEICRHLITNFSIACIRGNASELMALTNLSTTTKGVDSTLETTEILDYVSTLSHQSNAIIVMSGKIDVIIDGDCIMKSERGSPMMPLITGTGCLLSAVIAAFLSAHPNRFEAACAASVFYGICGEIAEKNSTGPGTFKIHFLDALYRGHP